MCRFHHAKQPSKTNNSEIKIQLWGDTQAISFKFHTIASGGDYGKFETNSSLDFRQEDSGEISMRMYSTTVYVNSGKLNEQEYTYTGHRKGNEIIFTRMQDSLNEGDFTDLETPSVLTIKSPTSVEFENRTYVQKKQ